MQFAYQAHLSVMPALGRKQSGCLYQLQMLHHLLMRFHDTLVMGLLLHHLLQHSDTSPALLQLRHISV